jgi:hypothetical protein
MISMPRRRPNGGRCWYGEPATLRSAQSPTSAPVERDVTPDDDTFSRALALGGLADRLLITTARCVTRQPCVVGIRF